MGVRVNSLDGIGERRGRHGERCAINVCALHNPDLINVAVEEVAAVTLADAARRCAGYIT